MDPQPNFQSLLDRLHDIKEKFDQEYENLINLIYTRGSAKQQERVWFVNQLLVPV